MATVRISDRGTITIPKELRAHVAPGGIVEVVLREDGVLELRPQIVVDASQAWFWSPRWQQMEHEADEDFAAGRVETFDDVESFLADLDARAGSAMLDADAPGPA
jgi:AbrB family looped-hinge helix DNA binding protein